MYSYDVNSMTGQNYKGLLIELQYRTIHQHAWATSVELVGFITENHPKFQRGDKRVEKILNLASEIIARAYEDLNGSLPDMPNEELVKEFLILDEELHFMEMLRGLNAADRDISERKNVILILSTDSDRLEIQTYRDATEALKALFVLEREASGRDMVLVRAESPEELRIAFKNYFSDAKEFITYVDEGCRRLSGQKLIRVRTRRVREPK